MTEKEFDVVSFVTAVFEENGFDDLKEKMREKILQLFPEGQWDKTPTVEGMLDGYIQKSLEELEGNAELILSRKRSIMSDFEKYDSYFYGYSGWYGRFRDLLESCEYLLENSNKQEHASLVSQTKMELLDLLRGCVTQLAYSESYNAQHGHMAWIDEMLMRLEATREDLPSEEVVPFLKEMWEEFPVMGTTNPHA